MLRMETCVQQIRKTAPVGQDSMTEAEEIGIVCTSVDSSWGQVEAAAQR